MKLTGSVCGVPSDRCPRRGRGTLVLVLLFSWWTLWSGAAQAFSGEPAPRTPLDAGWALLADPQEELTAQALTDLFDPDADAGFEHGLQVILAGLRPTQSDAG